MYCDGWKPVAFGEKSLPKIQTIFKILPLVLFISTPSFWLSLCDHGSCLGARGHQTPCKMTQIWNTMDRPSIQTGYLTLGIVRQIFDHSAASYT